MGESAGESRHISSPDLFAERFSAAVDYLGVKLPFVDHGKIGVIGSGGFALSSASVDTRIKALRLFQCTILLTCAGCKT